MAGEAIPKWYGKAYYKHDIDVTVCYPIQLNLIVRWFDKLKWWVICPMADQIDLAYQRGYYDGRQDESNRQRRIEILGIE